MGSTDMGSLLLRRGKRPNWPLSSRPRTGTQSRNRYPSGTSEQGARRTRIKKALQTPQADARTRTGDPFITSEVLYQLSYVGKKPAKPRFTKSAVSAVRPG